MWQHIRANRIRSVVLVIAMGVLLLAVGYAVGYFFFDSPTAGLVIALVIWAIMSLIGYFSGDSLLLGMSGARKISRDDHPRLYNIVEEMKIASGLEKMPDVYIIDDPALNAFATGRDPNRASVAVTTGLLEKLNRDELQGVIGHEMSHVKNRDVLLMAMTAVLLGTIVILAWYASRFLLYGGVGGSRRGSQKGGGGGGGQVIILVVAIVLLILAPIFAQLIYFALSRKREYLADASSALYTRYPEGLASALEKLGASTGQLKSANKANAPMYTVNPFRQKEAKAADLSSTHPPISERIRILRAMAGVSYGDYDRAYREVRHSRGILPAAAISGAGTLAIQKPAAEEPDATSRVRDTEALMWRLNKYKTIDCDCGTRLRVPPHFGQPTITCPHCGRIHPV